MVRIKDGACVGIDFSWYRWPDAPIRSGMDTDPVFNATPLRPGWLQLVAPKFGKGGDYGNGSVFVREDDTESA